MSRLKLGAALAAITALWGAPSWASPMLAPGSLLSLYGAVQINTSNTLATTNDPVTNTPVTLNPHSILIDYGLGSYIALGSFSALQSAGTVTFANQGVSVGYAALTSGSNLDCGSGTGGGCIYVVNGANGTQSTFDLTSETVTIANNSLTISGYGVATMTGFAETPGLFTLTTQLGGAPAEVSFSTTTASVPEPASTAILASALLSLTMMEWRRRHRRR